MLKKALAGIKNNELVNYILMKTLIGVDEAGRGCVLGPLVVCAFKIDAKLEPTLRELGVKDSKLLLPAARKKIYDKIIHYKHCVRIIPALELNELMGKRVSLNDIEAIKIAECLKELDDADATAFVDSPDSIPEKFARRIKKRVQLEMKIVSENKADLKYLVAGAASIIAKETREMEVSRIKKIVGDIGSGYSSDKKTIVFLKAHYGKNAKLDEFVRIHWETIKRLKTAQVKLKDYF